jgi:23S rRNA U2552 (ribose-2'-O)-methylase RlmE/FtsJ
MHKDIREIFYSLEKISDKWDPYFDVYEKHLSKFVGKAPRVLEIGVQNGGSIDMWLKYFGEGTTVVGIDVNPKCLTLSYPNTVEIVLGDQGDENFWKEFLLTHTNFDIVIDDGGHTMRQQIVTLDCVFPHLNEGGVFICEDTHTSYFEDWGGQINKNSTFLHYAKKLTDYLNKMHIPTGFISKKTINTFGDSLNSMSFYNSAVVLEKQLNKPFERVFSHGTMPNN